MKFSKSISILLSFAMLTSVNLRASDHLDFFGSIKNTAIPREMDLSDLFAWVPEEGKLVVAMNSHVFAGKDTQFSEKALYKFQIRGVEMVDSASGLLKKAQETNTKEVTITCRITNRVPICTTKGEPGQVSEEGLTVYGGGVMADPFVLDANWARLRFKQSGEDDIVSPKPLAKPENFSDYLNILNLTVEIDMKKIFCTKTKLIAVAGEVIAPGVVLNSDRVDRVGRPEITNMIVRVIDKLVNVGGLAGLVEAGDDPKLGKIGDPKLGKIKDIYNAADTFDLSDLQRGVFSNYIMGGIMGWDKQDGSSEWTGQGLLDLASVLVDDFLIVDTKKTCAYNVKSFLDIEKSVDGSYTSCGGRTPSEDIMDTLTSLYVAGPTATKEAHGDGVTRTRNMPSKEAPYFAAPFFMPETPVAAN